MYRVQGGEILRGKVLVVVQKGSVQVKGDQSKDSRAFRPSRP